MFVYREAYYLERKQPKLGSIEHAEWQSKMNDVNGLADIILENKGMDQQAQLKSSLREYIQNLKI